MSSVLHELDAISNRIFNITNVAINLWKCYFWMLSKIFKNTFFFFFFFTFGYTNVLQTKCFSVQTKHVMKQVATFKNLTNVQLKKLILYK